MVAASILNNPSRTADIEWPSRLETGYRADNISDYKFDISDVESSAIVSVFIRYASVSPHRHGGRYEYTALEADSSVHERLELERKARERAQNACQHYLRSCPRYTLLYHLNDIGMVQHRATGFGVQFLAQAFEHYQNYSGAHPDSSPLISPAGE
jgi:hypothetical protein